LSLCAEDLKELFERPDLECRAGMAVCTSAETFVEGALAASRRAVGAVSTHQLRALYFLVILGRSFGETLPVSLIQEGAEAVSALLPIDCQVKLTPFLH